MIPERTHVVVVNDNPDFLDLMADLLRDERYPTTVINGDREDAVELIRAADPNVLIIDLRLGRDDLHGWDVLQQVRGDRKLNELPTLICTGDTRALAELADDITGMRRVDSITKPFSIEELMSKLQGLMAREPA
jgi:CheY-like chemotaxis protein